MSYYISGGKDNWTKVSSNTLRGAKTAASRAYQQAVGGIIEVGQETADDGYSKLIERVAVKRGYDAWVDMP